MSVSSTTTDVTAESFGEEVVLLSDKKLVVVDFWAPWCAPCRTLGPVLEQLAADDAGKWALAKINIDEHQSLAFDFKVQGIPDVRAFRNGKVVHQFKGAMPRQFIRDWLDRLLPSELDELMSLGREAEERGDYRIAEQSYSDALGRHPEHPRPLVGLARLAIAQGNVAGAENFFGQIPDRRRVEVGAEYESVWLALEAGRSRAEDALRAAIDADGSDLQARYDLAIKLAARGAFEDAFEELLAIVARDRGFRDDIGRATMVRLFPLVEPEVARVWQAALGRTMY